GTATAKSLVGSYSLLASVSMAGSTGYLGRRAHFHGPIRAKLPGAVPCAVLCVSANAFALVGALSPSCRSIRSLSPCGLAARGVTGQALMACGYDTARLRSRSIGASTGAQGLDSLFRLWPTR